MKKYIIFLLALPLLLSSCLKEDRDVFGQLTGERLSEAQENLQNILKEAPNGWMLTYYPGRKAEYGGYRVYMKFDGSETVLISSEVSTQFQGASIEEAIKAIDWSLYDMKGDYGLTLNFVTYNKYFHVFAEPNTVGNDQNMGLGGDQEFTVVSAAADKIVLRGKKAQIECEMTPVPTDKSWEQGVTDYYTNVNTMDDFLMTCTLNIAGVKYKMDRKSSDGLFWRVFKIYTDEDGVTEAAFNYTPTGLAFRKPLEIKGVVISEMKWEGNGFVDEKSGAQITKIVSDNTFTLTTSNVKATSVDVSVTASIAGDTYYIGAYPKAMEATSSEAEIIAWVAAKIKSAADLSVGNVKRTVKVTEKTEYVACAFGATVSSAGTAATTKLFKSTPFTTPADIVATDAYKAWLGTWTVTSSSSEVSGSRIELHVTIAENVRNSSYLIYGWDISTLAQVRYPGIGKLSGAKIEISSNQTLGKYEDGTATWWTLCLFDGKMPTQMINGTFPAFTCTLGADKRSAAVANYEGGYSGGGSEGTFEAMSMTIFNEKSDGTYYVPSAPGYTARDFPMGSYTMIKAGDATTVNIMALNHINYVVDLEIYSRTAKYQAL